MFPPDDEFPLLIIPPPLFPPEFPLLFDCIATFALPDGVTISVPAAFDTFDAFTEILTLPELPAVTEKVAEGSTHTLDVDVLPPETETANFPIASFPVTVTLNDAPGATLFGALT